jgi:hypothetical protein
MGDECFGLVSPVEMSRENTTGMIRVERLADEVNRSDPSEVISLDWTKLDQEAGCLYPLIIAQVNRFGRAHRIVSD